MKALRKPAKPRRFGKFLVGERWKNLGRFVQLKFGRRLLLEVRIDEIGDFTHTAAYLTLAAQAKDWHSQKWQPVGKREKTKISIKQSEMFSDAEMKSPKPIHDLIGWSDNSSSASGEENLF